MKQIRAEISEETYREWKIAKAKLDAATNGETIRLLVERYEESNE